MKDKKKLIIIISMALVLMTACVVGIASCSKSNKTTGEKASTEIRENKNTSTGTESSKSTENTKAIVKETETQSEIEVSTQAPTNASTEAIAQTNASTEAIAPTNASTEAIAPTQPPTNASTEAIAPTEAPTQAKKGWGGTIYEELTAYRPDGTTKQIAKLDSELGDKIHFLISDRFEVNVFHNEVAFNISKPEDIVNLYGEPRLIYEDNLQADDGYTFIVYRYRYGHYTDDLNEQIYMDFHFEREKGNVLTLINAGGKCMLEDDWMYGITGDEWR